MPQLGVDPHTQRVQRAFNRHDERPEIVATEAPPHDDFLIAVPPDGPLGGHADIPARRRPPRHQQHLGTGRLAIPTSASAPSLVVELVAEAGGMASTAAPSASASCSTPG
jgi:hypothetical protein